MQLIALLLPNVLGIYWYILCSANNFALTFIGNISYLLESLGAMEDAFMKTTDAVLRRFNVSENLGLTQEEVRKNREKYGINGMYQFF